MFQDGIASLTGIHCNLIDTWDGDDDEEVDGGIECEGRGEETMKLLPALGFATSREGSCPD